MKADGLKEEKKKWESGLPRYNSVYTGPSSLPLSMASQGKNNKKSCRG